MNRKPKREDTMDDGTALARYFPGTWNYNATALLRRPPEQRPCISVQYHDEQELQRAKAVAPAFCQVEYYFVPATKRENK